MTAEGVSGPARQVATLETVVQSLRRGDTAEAARVALAALANGPEHPLLLNLRALDHETHGRLDAALADLTRAQALAPADFSLLNALGLCLGRMGRLEEAVARFDKAVGMSPRFAPAWFNRGQALERLGETAEAARSYERATEFAPDHAPAWANLAWLAARRGDAETARRCAGVALSLQSGLPTAVMALAQVEREQPAAAEGQMRELIARPDLSPYERALAYGILGDVLDAQGRTAEAFAAYAACNDGLKREAKAGFEGPGRTTMAQTLAWLVPWAERLDAGAWTAAPEPAESSGGERGHVFLMGFPRSGTTLIETVLGGHPDVVSLEERNTLEAGVRTFMADPAALSRLAGANRRELDPLRDNYWRRVRRFGVEPAGKIFIDKNPFNALKLPLIYKLFPNARVIFAVRDPRDVILSCFRRRFDLNPSTYELLDLGAAAAFYGATMRFAELMRAKQPLAEHLLVYERLMADFAGEVSRACAFIGAEWRSELAADVAERGRRGAVASASAAQIARGLYSEGEGQWRRYAEALAPVAPLLDPWIERFGYPRQ